LVCITAFVAFESRVGVIVIVVVINVHGCHRSVEVPDSLSIPPTSDPALHTPSSSNIICTSSSKHATIIIGHQSSSTLNIPSHRCSCPGRKSFTDVILVENAIVFGYFHFLNITAPLTATFTWW
jgi:hypothetical protein